MGNLQEENYHLTIRVYHFGSRAGILFPARVDLKKNQVPSFTGLWVTLMGKHSSKSELLAEKGIIPGVDHIERHS